MANASPRGNTHKTRLLDVERILYMRTNERRRMSIFQIIDALGLQRTENNARNVRNDLRTLREYGRPIATERHKATEYFWQRRIDGR